MGTLANPNAQGRTEHTPLFGRLLTERLLLCRALEIKHKARVEQFLARVELAISR